MTHIPPPPPPPPLACQGFVSPLSCRKGSGWDAIYFTRLEKKMSKITTTKIG